MTINFERFDEIEHYINSNVGFLYYPENIRSALINKFMQFFPTSYNNRTKTIGLASQELTGFLVVMSFFCFMGYIAEYYSTGYNREKNLTTFALCTGIPFIAALILVRINGDNWTKHSKLVKLMRSF